MGCATNERFGTIRSGGRIWAVGAIHGEAERLAALHAAIEERFQSGDRIVYLGNYLGHGTHVAATLDEMVAFRGALLAVPHMSVCDVTYLRGSQEEMWQKLFRLHLSVEPSSVLRWMMDRGVQQTLAAYGWGAAEAQGRVSNGSQEIARWLSELRVRMQQYPGHQELLASVRQAAFTDDGALLFVNSGLDPVPPHRHPERRLLVGERSARDADPALRRLQEDHPRFRSVAGGSQPGRLRCDSRWRRGVRRNAYRRLLRCRR